MGSPYIQVAGLRRMDLLHPDPKMIHLPSCAWSLAHENRYTGHAGDYSVAEHLVLGARLWQAQGRPGFEQAQYLFHDMHEAYTGDMAHPVKVAFETIAAGSWRVFEKLHMDCMEAFYGFEIHTADVKQLDMAMCNAEADQLFGRRLGPDWPPVDPAPVVIEGWLGERAFAELMFEISRLTPHLLLRGPDSEVG